MGRVSFHGVRSRCGVPFAVLLALAGASSGCGGDEPPAPASSGAPPADVPCAIGERELEDGRCQPPGLPLDMACPPGETPLADGACQAAGVPPSKCGAGFEADGEQGCKPILPDEPCLSGMVAKLGETACHAVAPCGQGDYGDIPVEADTQFVNAAYMPLDSDGTKAKPWKTIQQGINAAKSGAIVAVAAGTYSGDIKIAGTKVVRLWGRCPSMVAVKGSGATDYALWVSGISAGSSQIQIRGVGVTGPKNGIGVDDAPDVLIENVWVHDVPKYGVLVEDTLGATKAILRSSLIERMGGYGVANHSATMTVEDTTVRDVLVADAGKEGDDIWDGLGIVSAFREPAPNEPSITIKSSIVERATSEGVLLQDTDAAVEGLVVRDAKPTASKDVRGRGVLARRSTISLKGSVIERAHHTGIDLYCSTGTIEQVTVRDTQVQPVSDDYLAYGSGIIAVDDCGACSGAACLTIRESLVDEASCYGIGTYGMDVLIDATAVRDIKENGLVAQVCSIGAHESSVVVRRSVVERGYDAGIAASIGSAVIEESLVRNIKAIDNVKGGGGCVYIDAGGANLAPLADLTVRGSHLEDCAVAGVYAVGAATSIEATIIKGVTPKWNGDLGDGIFMSTSVNTVKASATITGTRIESVARVGVSNFGSIIDLGHTAVACTQFDLTGEESYGRSFSYNKLGENVCGCSETTDECQVLSPGFAAPPLTPRGPPSP